MHFRFIHTFPIYLCMSSLHSPPPPPTHTPHPITVIHHPSPASSAMQAAPKLPWQPLGLSSLQPHSYWKKSSGSSLRLSGGCGNWLGVSNHPHPRSEHTQTRTSFRDTKNNPKYILRNNFYGQYCDWVVKGFTLKKKKKKLEMFSGSGLLRNVIIYIFELSIYSSSLL